MSVEAEPALGPTSLAQVRGDPLRSFDSSFHLRAADGSLLHVC
jgi:hypothetical protein